MNICWKERAEKAEAERDELKSKWKREECAHCDERVGGYQGTIWCAECFNWWVVEHRVEALEAQVEALRQGWAKAKASGFQNQDAMGLALSLTPPEALERLKTRERRAGAAEELRRLREYIQQNIGPDDARDEIRRICANRVSKLSAAELEAAGKEKE